MNNIRFIQNSKLWKKITTNKNYRGHIVLDTYNKPYRHRVGGFFFVLLVFFNSDINERTLKKYRREGALMSKGEGLDNPETINFYGNFKMLRYS